MTRAALNLLVLVSFVACSEQDFSDVRPIEFTSQTVSVGLDLKELQFTWTVNATTGADDYQLVEIDHYRLEINPDGASGYSQVDLNHDGKLDELDQRPATANSLEAFLAVHLTDFNNARYQIVARDSGNNEIARSGELFLLDIAVEELIGYFKASNTDEGDIFGRVSLSGDGNTLAVGAAGEDSDATRVYGDQGNKKTGTPPEDDLTYDAGAVYVFQRDAVGIWSQEAYIKASNTDAGDRFGGSVSLSKDGDTLVVGAEGERSNATGINGDQSDNSLEAAGAVYVFQRDGGWSQEAYIKASNTDAFDRFGGSVSVSGDGARLAVGAVGEASNGSEGDNSLPDSGAVYVFRRSSGAWSQDAYLKASNIDAGDEFGASASLSPSGARLAVGAVGEASNATGIDGVESNNDMPYAGAVYVFSRGATWSQQAYIKASNTDADDEFGSSVSLSTIGTALAVGAVGEASNATGIYTPPFEGDDLLRLGNNDMPNAGAVYGYVYVGPPAPLPQRGWKVGAYIKASNTGGGDGFGAGVSLSGDGNTLAVGAPGEASDATGIGGDQGDDSLSASGAAYSFRRPAGEAWAQLNYIKASNTDAGDEFGGGVSLSEDGDTLAIGAEFEESNAKGIGGDQDDQSNNSAEDAGAVYLY